MKKRRLLMWLLAPVAALVALLLLVTAIGLLLPRQHVASRTLKSRQSSENIWRAITDYEGQTAWRKDLKKVERLPDKDGHEVWREVYEDGSPLTMETTEMVAPTRLVRTIKDEGGPFSGRWEYEIKPTGAGASSLTITERGEVPNPFFRFVSRFVIGHTYFMERFQKDLAAKFGEEAVIVSE
ncbi:MAG TPA: SRPBCC family protein [Pyrinomonadaceae bacterium]|nr:SRPBCC family protein [Pyrinomonadaceae bacterium]